MNDFGQIILTKLPAISRLELPFGEVKERLLGIAVMCFQFGHTGNLTKQGETQLYFQVN